jgi:hypothetical protein
MCTFENAIGSKGHVETEKARSHLSHLLACRWLSSVVAQGRGLGDTTSKEGEQVPSGKGGDHGCTATDIVWLLVEGCSPVQDCPESGVTAQLRRWRTVYMRALGPCGSDDHG